MKKAMSLMLCLMMVVSMVIQSFALTNNTTPIALIDDDGFVLDHNSFVAEGQFNSTIRYTSCEFGHGKPVVNDKQNFPIPSNCNFLLVGEAGGKGTIDTVYFKSANTSDADAAFDYIVEGTHIER
jgi:hypothetical protein